MSATERWNARGLSWRLVVALLACATAARAQAPVDHAALYEAAKKEGEVVVWGQAGVERRAFVKEAFEKAFPGIRVTYFQAGNSSERDNRFIQEMKAGVAKVDILHGGSVSAAVNLKPLGLLQPARPLLDSSILDGRNWRGGETIWVDPERRYFLIGDSQVYPAAAVHKSIGANDLKSWEDLLDPKYDGKIVMRDPRASGNGFTTAMFLNHNPNLGLDYLGKFLARGRVVFSTDERLNVEWVDSGRMLVAVYARTQEVEALQQVGGAVRMIPVLSGKGEMVSSVSSTDGIVFLPKLDPLPHPNATRLYLDWFYSRAGQQAMVDALGTDTYRTDVDVGKLSPALRPVAGATYLNMNDEKFARPEAIKLIRDAVNEAVRK